MFERIIRFSINQRHFVFLGTLAIAVIGIFNYERLPIDAVPDITNVQVQINVDAAGFTPLEVEQQITFPLESVLSGVTKLDHIRSLSRYGLSQITVVFEEDTDIYFARQLVSERLQIGRDKLPPGINPVIGPTSTGLGEIFMYTVTNKVGTTTPLSPTELRTAQDWIVKPQLRTIPGVVEVNSIGGYQKQFHILPRIDRLLSLGLSLRDLVEAVSKNSSNIGAGYIERNGEQYLVRVPGQIVSIEALQNVIVTSREGKPIFLSDVAEISLGKELRTGAATENGEEVVLGTVFMLIGENSRTVSSRVGQKIKEINRSLPESIVAKPVYERTMLVDRTISTVKTNLTEGALLVIVILFLFLRNFRAALITALVIPLSMLVAISGMVETGISASLMSLGALDFGLIVDGSVIIVENCLRRLAEAQHRFGRQLTKAERFSVVFEASREVRQATMFGELIIIIVYLPILTLTGIEGKMFFPMALTVVLALAGAVLFSLTFVPAAVATFVTGDIREAKSSMFIALQRRYARLLDRVLSFPKVVLIGAVVILAFSLLLGTRVGTEFAPNLDEGDIALHALRIPGTSLTQAVEMQRLLENQIRTIPEVSHTFTKIGTAEIANDPMPPNVADGFVILRPREEWSNPRKPKQQLVSELEAVVKKLPGNNYEFTQPIQMRFNELIAGVRSDVAVKIFGDDLNLLSTKGEEIAEVLNGIEGSADVKVEPLSGLPMLSIEIDRIKTARFGISVSDVQQTIRTAIGGEVAGQLFEGDRRFDIVVRLPEENRVDITAISSLPVAVSSLTLTRDEEKGSRSKRVFVPLSSLAEVKLTSGANQISRENGKRRIVITSNVRGRDLGGYVEEARSRVENAVSLPSGYWMAWGGQFEHLISARNRLFMIVPLALTLIITLLWYSFASLRYALIVFSGVPLALTGGVLSLVLRGIPFSVSAGIGFIALSGVAVLNGLVMLTAIRSLYESGMTMLVAIKNGAHQRLRPVLITGLVASLGFVPMALATGPGSEVQRPLATVVVGGILSSTALTLFVLPALVIIFAKPRLSKPDSF